MGYQSFFDQGVRTRMYQERDAQRRESMEDDQLKAELADAMQQAVAYGQTAAERIFANLKKQRGDTLSIGAQQWMGRMLARSEGYSAQQGRSTDKITFLANTGEVIFCEEPRGRITNNALAATTTVFGVPLIVGHGHAVGTLREQIDWHERLCDLLQVTVARLALEAGIAPEAYPPKS